MIKCLATAGASTTAGILGIGWLIARKVTGPEGPRKFGSTIRGVETFGDRRLLVLDRNNDTTSPGIFNLWFETGASLRVACTVYDRGPRRVARIITHEDRTFNPSRGDRYSWSGIYYADPVDAGVPTSEVFIGTLAGPAPAIFIEGRDNPAVWAIHIHGLGGSRISTLRSAQVAYQLGYSSLLISYRNDSEGPRFGSGRSTLGHTETDDALAAIAYAVDNGAKQIILFGWSMGALIALQAADRIHDSKLIGGLVLDSPVLNWTKVIKTTSARNGLPALLGGLVSPWLQIKPLALTVGLPSKVPLHNLNWLAPTKNLTYPALILHGTRDDTTPITASRQMQHRHPDRVTLATFDANHTFTWNSQPQRWRSIVRNWLLNHTA